MTAWDPWDSWDDEPDRVPNKVGCVLFMVLAATSVAIVVASVTLLVLGLLR